MTNQFKTYDKILMAHGSGGRLTQELISELFKPEFSNPVLDAFDDAAELKNILKKGESLAFTTDSFVVDPLFFPGGDIGKLSVCGTVNDLAMKGARPVALAVSAIIEEGLDMGVLRTIVASFAATAKEAGVFVAAGDTKVVGKGKADKLFLTTTGIGVIAKGVNISSGNARPGDCVLLNGSIGDHGMAVLSARNEFKLKSNIKSDCAPLNKLVKRMLGVSKDIHVLRDPTRGGLATALNEISFSSGCGIIVEESNIPVKKAVRNICNLLGFDPLYVANEGKLLGFAGTKVSAKILASMKKDKYGKESRIIGRVVKSPKGIWLKTVSGGLRPLIMLEGDQLPRIC